jgi:hypothetical protein
LKNSLSSLIGFLSNNEAIVVALSSIAIAFPPKMAEKQTSKLFMQITFHKINM